jgi:hypothetical protein
LPLSSDLALAFEGPATMLAQPLSLG